MNRLAFSPWRVCVISFIARNSRHCWTLNVSFCYSPVFGFPSIYSIHKHELRLSHLVAIKVFFFFTVLNREREEKQQQRQQQNNVRERVCAKPNPICATKWSNNFHTQKTISQQGAPYKMCWKKMLKHFQRCRLFCRSVYFFFFAAAYLFIMRIQIYLLHRLPPCTLQMTVEWVFNIMKKKNKEKEKKSQNGITSVCIENCCSAKCRTQACAPIQCNLYWIRKRERVRAPTNLCVHSIHEMEFFSHSLTHSPTVSVAPALAPR